MKRLSFIILLLLLLSGCINEKKFVVTFVDINGNVIEVQELKQGTTVNPPEVPQIPDYVFAGWNNDFNNINEDITITVKMQKLESFTEANDTRSYMYYGYYPQTLITDHFIIEALNKLDETLPLYYEGEEYYKYDNKYFLIEEIKWIVLDNYDNTYLLMSDKVLDAEAYYQDITKTKTPLGNDILNSSYYYSHIRTWLNNDFLNTAFTGNLQSLMISSIIETEEYVCHDYTVFGDPMISTKERFTVSDKVALLNRDMLRQSKYGFVDHLDLADEARIAIASDFAKAKGCYLYEDYARYWVRDNVASSWNDVYAVTTSGHFFSGNDVTTIDNYGTRVIIRINY